MPTEDNQTSNVPPKLLRAMEIGAGVLKTFIERFGWPGSSVIAGVCFVWWYSTPDQKKEIIDVYVLGKGVSQTWPLFVAALLCIGVKSIGLTGPTVTLVRDSFDLKIESSGAKTEYVLAMSRIRMKW